MKPLSVMSIRIRNFSIDNSPNENQKKTLKNIFLIPVLFEFKMN